MKKLTIALILISAASAMTGCATKHNNGDCVTQVDGVCLLEWQDGQKVASGDIDVRYTGLKMVNGEISGTVSSKARSWK